MIGFVYFITSEPDEYVKVGWSLNHPADRLRVLQTGCPQPLRLMAFAPASREEERRLHLTFADLQYRSEWFFMERKLLDLVSYLSDGWPRPTKTGASRQEFENALWDAVITGCTYPDMPDELSYLASGDGSYWHHIHPQVAQ